MKPTRMMASLLAAALLGTLTSQTHAQEVAAQQAAPLGSASHLVIPQSRAFDLHSDRHARSHQPGGIVIERVSAHIEINEQTAATTLEVSMKNTSRSQAEAVILLPVPDDAAVSSFMFQGASAEPTAVLLPADEARRTYDQIVAQLRDPALLEFAGYNLIRSSVFPIEPNGQQTIRISYDTILKADGQRIDYILPRSESLDARVPWNVTIDIRAHAPISMVYSPTHTLEETARDATNVRCRVADSSRLDAGPFRLSYLLERDGVTASLFSYPDPSVGGGYFLLLAGLPASIDDADRPLMREVTLVLDRSGSMANGKLDQVKDAAIQIIEGLEDGEAFNIIDYSNKAAKLFAGPMLKNTTTVQQAREYLATLKPNGGTNIHDALLEALRQEPLDSADMLPIVLFLTDGLPTVGRTNELAIRELIEKGNTHHRRVFTFGAGADVNAPLLDRLAELSRAKSTYVLPGEDVELRVAQTFRALYGPVLADVALDTRNADGSISTTRIREQIPSEIADVFEGDQLVLLGQYRDADPVTFQLSGNFLGTQRTFSFTFDFEDATTEHAFVPRLWASRRIAFLVDEIRQAGASAGLNTGNTAALFNDPRFKELIDEIVRLSTEFGVLSEYTSFLAREGTDLSDWNNLVTACSAELNNKAVHTRSGIGAVNQSMNVTAGKGQHKLAYNNSYWNDQLELVEITTVQQLNDRAFFKRGDNWVDGQLVAERQTVIEPDEVIVFGSPEHRALMDELIYQKRQACASLEGDVLIRINQRNILIRNPIMTHEGNNVQQQQQRASDPIQPVQQLQQDESLDDLDDTPNTSQEQLLLQPC
ncbi:MAG: VIT domain-containing protein [Phycisphaerales bacterium]